MEAVLLLIICTDVICGRTHILFSSRDTIFNCTHDKYDIYLEFTSLNGHVEESKP